MEIINEIDGKTTYFKYPFVIPIVIIIFLIIFIVVRIVSAKFHKGVLVANTKYVKRTTYYRYLQSKYLLISILVVFFLFIAMIADSLVIQRLVKTKEDENKASNRDILLCMDVSGSMYDVNRQVILNLQKTIGKLKGERFGIVLFDNSSVDLSPLTTDYKYINSILDDLAIGFDYRNQSNLKNRSYWDIFIHSGTREASGSSLIGDGLASCTTFFAKDEIDRTRVIIFTTDNFSGKSLISLNEAATIAKQNNISVYSIAPPQCSSEGLKQTAAKTGGKYYNIADNPVDSVVKNILALEESEIDIGSSVQEDDKPEIFIIATIIAISVLFILERIVRL